MPEVTWLDSAKDIFDKITGNLPQFHRAIAQKLVKQSAEDIAFGKNKPCVEEDDLIEALFKEVPPAFKEMMKRLLTKLDIDYSQFING